MGWITPSASAPTSPSTTAPTASSTALKSSPPATTSISPAPAPKFCSATSPPPPPPLRAVLVGGARPEPLPRRHPHLRPRAVSLRGEAAQLLGGDAGEILRANGKKKVGTDLAVGGPHQPDPAAPGPHAGAR